MSGGVAESADPTAAHPCIIALCKCGCNRVVYANAADELDDRAQREVGKMVAEGYQVVRTTVGDARSRDWFCETKRRERAETEAAMPENAIRSKYEAAMAEMRAAQAPESDAA